ncbi:hypothetical protein [Leptothoe spongobia]|uniref:hypothetical protein n=1 Tax=Leptothoe spongobia TaxID=2651728 RepID=UPI001C01826D|nr:hypothetical protein [Leptothoe spongobia]
MPWITYAIVRPSFNDREMATTIAGQAQGIAPTGCRYWAMPCAILNLNNCNVGASLVGALNF